MGITIHYRGKLGQKVKARELYIFASLICKEKGWEISGFAETEGEAMLEHPDGEIPYTGKLSTFAIRPHEHCEPLTFQITADGKSLPSTIRLVISFDGDTSFSPKAVAYEKAIEEGKKLAGGKTG